MQSSSIFYSHFRANDFQIQLLSKSNSGSVLYFDFENSLQGRLNSGNQVAIQTVWSRKHYPAAYKTGLLAMSAVKELQIAQFKNERHHQKVRLKFIHNYEKLEK